MHNNIQEDAENDQLKSTENSKDVIDTVEDESQPTKPDSLQNNSDEIAPHATDLDSTHSLEVPSNSIVAETSKKRRFLHPFRRLFGRHARIALVVSIILLMSGVASAAYLYKNYSSKQPVVNFSATVEPFKIIKTTPSDSQTNVTQVNKVVVTFNRPVDPAKLNGDFFVSPQIEGTYSQGATNEEVVFTPKAPFAEGTVVKIMIHGEFQSIDGSQLGADYSFGFTTTTPDNQVIFQRQNYIETVGSAPVGKTQTYTLSVGQQVDPNGEITVYKSDIPTLLSSLIYGDKTNEGYTYPAFINNTVDISSMKAVQTQKGLKDASSLKVSQAKGVYAIVASVGGKQVGFTWLVVSNTGVIVRQDDQKMVLSAQDLQTNAPVKAAVTLYSLKNSKQQLGNVSVDGLATINTPYTPKVDIAVATNGDDTAIVPVAEFLSLADLRVQKDLSAEHKIYGVTDKPAYGIGETIHYSAFVRTDNDALYAVPNGGTLSLYVAAYAGDTHRADFTATVQPNGQISGSFTAAASFITAGQTSEHLQIFAASPNENNYFDQSLAGFTVTSAKQSTYGIKVQFDKSEYISSDKVSTTISATNADGTPLANTTINVDEYAKDYFENDSASNQASFGSIGGKINDASIPVILDSKGAGVFTVDVSKLPAGRSQVVTIQASKTDPAGAVAGGGAAAIIHLGNGTLEFGPSKTVISPNSNVVARIYAKTLSGDVLPNTNVNYNLTANSKQIASGSAKTDSMGYVEITQAVGSIATPASVIFDAWATDSANNKIEATNYYYVDNAVSGSGSYSELQLSGLDISGSPKDVQVGQTVNLIIDAPQDVRALVTLERGRIHKYEIVNLKAGKNTYSVDITPDMAPSFSLAFSYFNQGAYHVDGVPFDVSPSNKQATVKITADKLSYSAGDTATIKINTSYGTAPLPTDMIVGVVDNKVFSLFDQMRPDMFTYMYAPRELAVNSSSSLTSIGSGGGKCGGGFNDSPGLTSPTGSTLLWVPAITTNASGEADVHVKLPKGSWRVYAYSMSSDSVVGSADATLIAQ